MDLLLSHWAGPGSGLMRTASASNVDLPNSNANTTLQTLNTLSYAELAGSPMKRLVTTERFDLAGVQSQPCTGTGPGTQ